MTEALSHLGEKETCSNYRGQNSAFLFKANTSHLRIVKTAAGCRLWSCRAVHFNTSKMCKNENFLSFFHTFSSKGCIRVELS